MIFRIIREELVYFLMVVLLSLWAAAVTCARAEAQNALAVPGCEILGHPSRYSDKMVVIKGRYAVGFESSNISFGCPGSIGIRVSTSAADRRRYGFLTHKATLAAMSRLPPGEHPGDNLMTRTERYALVTVVGLFTYRHGAATCIDARRGNASLVVKSMQFNSPFSENPPPIPQ